MGVLEREILLFQCKTLVSYQILVLFTVSELLSPLCKVNPTVLHILSVINVSNFPPALLTCSH